jgi:hypothetical protein
MWRLVNATRSRVETILVRLSKSHEQTGFKMASPGLIRVSIVFYKKLSLQDRWVAGSSPATTSLSFLHARRHARFLIFPPVIRALDPRIHRLLQKTFFARSMGCRVEPGNDEGVTEVQ